MAEMEKRIYQIEAGEGGEIIQITTEKIKERNPESPGLQESRQLACIIAVLKHGAKMGMYTKKLAETSEKDRQIQEEETHMNTQKRYIRVHIKIYHN